MQVLYMKKENVGKVQKLVVVVVVVVNNNITCSRVNKTQNTTIHIL